MFYSTAGSIDFWLGTGKVALNDLCFSILAFSMSSTQLVQCFMYERGSQGDIKYWVVIFLVCLYLAVIVTFIIEASGHPVYDVHWDTFSIAGYGKAAITFVKYCPQVYLNWKRKSTVGWSLANVMLDLTGGLLSFLQIVIDSAVLGNSMFGGEAFNVVKFALSVFAIIFDTIFLI